MNTPRAAVRPNPGNTFALDHDWYEESITEHADGTFSIPDEVVQELADEASKLIAGELLAGEILTGSRHPMLETFRPERFS